MIFKSIKWRLQIWYGLILVAVLAGLGLSAYQLERTRQFAQIDDALQRRFSALAAQFRPPPHGPEHEGPPRDFPPPEEDGGPRAKFHWPAPVVALFDAGDPNKFYFIIQSRDGDELARSSNAPPANDFYAPRPERPEGPRPPDFRTIGGYRELARMLPRGETILVGCSVAAMLQELRLTALKLAGVGGIILFFGLAGGGWLVTRALRPIESISRAAVKISAGDLAQRISTAETESELGQLAIVLNSTFARLESAFAQQKQFAADAAHELRTPVTVLLTQTQTALTRDRTADEYRETVEVCQRAAQRMRKLIGDLLELARLDAGQEQMKRSKFNLSQLARDCVEAVGPLAAQRAVRIEAQLPPIEAAGDAGRIGQVITNLLVNAIEYNYENGQVQITTQSRNGTALLAVSNTGPGIAAADLPHLFERFYRADPSRSSSHNGLGLSISRAIIEAHGGTIEVSSTPEAITTFTLRIP